MFTGVCTEKGTYLACGIGNFGLLIAVPGKTEKRGNWFVRLFGLGQKVGDYRTCELCDVQVWDVKRPKMDASFKGVNSKSLASLMFALSNNLVTMDKLRCFNTIEELETWSLTNRE